MFDAMPLLESRTPSLGRKAVSTAVVLHSLLFVALLVFSLLATVAPGDPPPVPGLFEFHRPLDLPQIVFDLTKSTGGREGMKRPARPRIQPPAAQPQAPRPVSDPVQPRQESATAPVVVPRIEKPNLEETREADRSLDPGGTDPTAGDAEIGPGTGESGDGSGTGEAGLGIGDGPPAWDPNAIAGEADAGIEPPVLIHRVEPAYPAIARLGGIEGLVILEGVIAADGRIESLNLVKSILALDPAALSAVRQWVYTPARRGGVPVRVRVTIRVQFDLR